MAYQTTEADAHEGHVAHPGEIAIGVIIGRSSEFFDFFVFAIASVLVFPKVMFPAMPLLDGVLWSFAIFALGFVARPFGTFLFMAVDRRYGRGAKLTAALFLLGCSTAGIAFTPDYSVAGWYAIGILSIMRFSQGLALGGAWDGLASLLAMNAPEEKRGWYAIIARSARRWDFLSQVPSSSTSSPASARRTSFSGGGVIPSSWPSR